MTISQSTFDLISEEVKNGFVSRRDHPRFPISIYNYTNKCIFEHRWNDVTMSCRGLVIEHETNRVVTWPLPKMFNHSDGRIVETWNHLKKGGVFWERLDKADGTMILLFKYADEWVFSTRGSFENEYVNIASEFFHWIKPPEDPEFTYIFELIHPKAKVVIDYGGNVELRLIAARNETKDLFHPSLLHVSRQIGCTTIEHLDCGACPIPDFEDRKNREGVVYRFTDGTRIKVKQRDYIVKHAAIFALSTKQVWESLRDSNGDYTLADFISLLPDEVHDWVIGEAQKIIGHYSSLEVEARLALNKYFKHDRKEMAEVLMAADIPNKKQIMSLVWLLLDKKRQDFETLLWEFCEPEFSTPQMDLIGYLPKQS